MVTNAEVAVEVRGMVTRIETGGGYQLQFSEHQIPGGLGLIYVLTSSSTHYALVFLGEMMQEKGLSELKAYIEQMEWFIRQTELAQKGYEFSRSASMPSAFGYSPTKYVN